VKRGARTADSTGRPPAPGGEFWITKNCFGRATPASLLRQATVGPGDRRECRGRPILGLVQPRFSQVSATTESTVAAIRRNYRRHDQHAEGDRS
jgi:hypothetical protein